MLKSIVKRITMRIGFFIMVCCCLIIIRFDRYKRREQFTSLTFLPGIAKHLNHLKRVNAHAERREQSTSVLDDSFFILAISERNKNQKWTSNVLCPYYVVMSSYAVWFGGLLFIILACKDSANRAKNQIYLSFSLVQPILAL